MGSARPELLATLRRRMCNNRQPSSPLKLLISIAINSHLPDLKSRTHKAMRVRRARAAYEPGLTWEAEMARDLFGARFVPVGQKCATQSRFALSRLIKICSPSTQSVIDEADVCMQQTVGYLPISRRRPDNHTRRGIRLHSTRRRYSSTFLALCCH
jgi:hypothetical protein